MKHLLAPLLLSLLPLTAVAATPPTHAQIEASILAMIEAEKKPAASTQDLLLRAMFTPRGFAHGPCFASATVSGAYECLVGMEMGIKTRYRMLRFVPQGMGWGLVKADVPAPVPPRERARELLSERLDARVADIADATARGEMRAFQQRLQVIAIEDCALRDMGAAEITCEVTAGADNERGTEPQTYVFDAQGQWQNAAANADR
jgi:hypothetical protein